MERKVPPPNNAQQNPQEQELVGDAQNQRNWRGIGIALLVILIVCALVVTAMILATPSSVEEELGEKFTLNDAFDPNYKPRYFSVNWIASEDKLIYRNEDGALFEYDCLRENSSLIMDNTTFRQFDTSMYSVSPDRKYVLITYDVIRIFRHSYSAKYEIYDVNTRVTTAFGGPQREKDRLSFVLWAPTGHSAVFGMDNNLYYQPNINDSTSIVQLTKDGEDNMIFNGVPDWLYEEEILSSNTAVWFSKSGTYLAYASFNDSMVTDYEYPYYGYMENQYTKINKLKYPKAGATNPTVKLRVVYLESGHQVELRIPTDYTKPNSEYYLTNVVWMNDDYLAVTWTNRPQNYSIITVCGGRAGTCHFNIDEKVANGWIDTLHPYFVPDGSKYFIKLPVNDGKSGHYKHVCQVSLKSVMERGQKLVLTQGEWEVTDIVGYNNDTQDLYFIGTGGDSRKRHLYSISVKDDSKVKYPHYCLTCSEDYDDCQYVEAQFSPSGKFYILKCLGPGVPTSALYSSEHNKLIMTLEDNSALKERLKIKALPQIRYMKLKIEGKNGNYETWAKLQLPAVLKDEEILTYPLVLEVYGGPGNQKVTQKFDVGYSTYLTSALNIIVASVDGRGSGGNGDRFMHELYKAFGTVEIEDQITAGREFEKLRFVESSKIAVWGWSYGGFVTSSILGRGTDIFKCGIAVAPVTDWRYYDSAYTERYMGDPYTNLASYKISRVAPMAPNFRKSSFLLIHGTGDDNVHFQNSAQLMKALTDANVYYRTQIYPDEQHLLNGRNTYRHVHETMADFLMECFNGKSKKFEERTKKHEELTAKEETEEE